MLEQVGTITVLSLNFISKNLDNKIFISHLLLSNTNTIFEPIRVLLSNTGAIKASVFAINKPKQGVEYV